MSGFNGEVWRNLLRLTADNVSEDTFMKIMKEELRLPHSDIFKLSPDQAHRLYQVLQPLESLYMKLFASAEPVVGPELAEKVARAQLDGFAIDLVKNANFSLFENKI